MNNPSAFSRPASERSANAGAIDEQDGMTLLDYFAAAALPELVRAAITGEVDDYKPAHVAHDAYNYAEAMLAERERRQL